MVNQLIESGAFTLNKLQERFSGISSDDRTIYSVWQQYIDDKNAEGEVGTARTNVDVKRRFERTMGRNVAFADIDKSLIQKWAKMLEYNWYLLHDKSEKDTQSPQDKQALLALLKNMSEDERNALMASLCAKTCR